MIRKMKDKLEVLGSSAVQAHIAMLQGIINRMAGNSAHCKNWTVTLVAAMLVLLVDKEVQIRNAWLCLIPVGLFYLLDCYYLGLERATIEAQKKFLNDLSLDELYKVGTIGGRWIQLGNTMKAMCSPSTTPFYLIVVLLVLLFGEVI